MAVQSLMPAGTSTPSHHHGYGALSMSIEEGACDCDDDLFFDGAKGAVTSEEVVDEVSIIANTVNALLGVSLFAMPWGFQQSGVLCGVIILCVVAVLSFDTSRMLLVCQKYYYMRNGEVKSYPEIAAAALGPHWHAIVQTATIVSCLGGCTGYIIFFGDTVGQALSLAPTTVLLAATIPLILLSWIRTFRDMTIFTVFGVVALVVTVLVILYDGSQKMSAVSLAEVEMFRPHTAINFLGQVTFLFTIHYTTLAMGAETLKLKSWISQHVDDEHSETSYSALTTPIAWSWGLSAFLVGLVGVGGFVMYRSIDFVTDADGNVLIGCEDRVCQNAILNVSPGILRNIVGFMMALAISLSFILNLAPAREHIERIVINRYFSISTERQDVVVRNVLRTVLVLGMVTVAIKAPYFGNMLGSVGGLTDAVQCFVFPPMIFLKLEGDKLSTWYRNTCRLTVVWGAFIILYTVSNLTMGVFS